MKAFFIDNLVDVGIGRVDNRIRKMCTCLAMNVDGFGLTIDLTLFFVDFKE